MATYLPPYARHRQLAASARREQAPVVVRSQPVPVAVPEVTEVPVEEPADAETLVPVVQDDLIEDVTEHVEEVTTPEDTEDRSPVIPASETDRLLEYSRKELNDMALTLGIEHPEKLPNKNAVVEAILKVKT